MPKNPNHTRITKTAFWQELKKQHPNKKMTMQQYGPTALFYADDVHVASWEKGEGWKPITA
jgi:hypothetical protein